MIAKAHSVLACIQQILLWLKKNAVWGSHTAFTHQVAIHHANTFCFNKSLYTPLSIIL
jgi:hypothetical protein